MVFYHHILESATNAPYQDALLTVVGFALVTHLVFNRFEPFGLPSLIFFLAFIPLALTVLLQGHFYAPVPLIYHATLLCSIAVYRVSPFHPLARYPGPLLLKLSSIWVYRMSVSGKRHEYIHNLHEQYQSDIVRTGPNEIAIRDAAAISPIMGTNGLSKGPGYDGRTGFAKNRSLVSWRDPVIHAQRRQPWNRGMRGSALKEYEVALAARITQLVDKTIASAGNTLDLSLLFKYFSYDFMGDMAFAGGSELMRDGDVHGTMENFETAMKAGNMAETFPWYAYYAPNGLSRFLKASRERAMARISQASSSKDLFYYLNNDDGAETVGPSLSTVVAEASLVIIAGSDTTSATLSNIMFLLLQHSQAYERLQQEIDKFYPAGENALDSVYHSEMHFMDAVINETLRIYPVVPSGGQRATKENGTSFSSYYIPPYTAVRVHTWSIHRDPRNFSPMPDAFWPERWLIAENPSCKPETLKVPFVHNEEAFIPFSFGPANCVGKNLAMREMRMVLCHLLQHVDVRFADGYDPARWDMEAMDYLTMDVGKLPVIVTPRTSKLGAVRSSALATSRTGV